MKSQPKNPSILYVITQDTWGGAQRYIFDLSAKISQNCAVSVAIGEPQGPADLSFKLKDQSARRIPVLPLRHLQRAINPYHDLLAIFELRRLYKKNQPDIVHLNSSKAGILGSLAVVGIKNRPKIIYTVHGWVFRESLNRIVKKIYTYLEKWTARFKDTIIVLSQTEKNDAEHILHIPPKKLMVIPLGIEPPHFLSKAIAREKILQLANMPEYSGSLVGTIANLYKNKGLDILIAAAKIVQEKNSTLHFFIIGSGPEEINLKNLIAAQKISTVHLLGNYDNAAELLPAFDLFVLPSRKEGLPYTILEAMAARLPIVATAVGGVPDLANQYEDMQLVAPNNPIMLTDSIIKKLTEKKSAPIQGTDFTVFSPSEMIDRTLTLYSSHSRASEESDS